MTYFVKSTALLFTIFSISVLLLFSGMFISLAFAQEEDGTESSQSRTHLVANVNIFDAQYTRNDDGSYTIEFELNNQGDAQTGIKYAVELIQFGGEQSDGQRRPDVIADQEIYDEQIDLAAGETRNITVQYTPPRFLDGTYSIRVFSETVNGLPLAGSTIGEVVLRKDPGTLLIDQARCYLDVEGDPQGYSAEFGVDVAPEENISLECDIQNDTESDQVVVSKMDIYERTTFSGEYEQVTLNENVLIEPGTQPYSFGIPKPEKPQAYIGKMYLTNESGERISNEVTARFVVQGLSATIQNFTFDKTYYEAGEIAHVSVLLSGLADTFVNARGGNEDRIEDFKVAFMVTGEGGVQCSERITRNLGTEFNGRYLELDVPITNDCMNPTVSVQALSGDDVIDSESFAYTTKATSTPGEIFAGLTAKELMVLGIILLGVLLSVWIGREGRKASMASFIVGLAVFAGGFLAGGTEVNAATLYVENPQSNATAWVNINKSTYDPRENVRAEGEIRIDACNNSMIDAWVEWDINSNPDTQITYVDCPCDPRDCSGHGGHTCWSSKEADYKRAPQVSGRHQARFKLSNDNRYVATDYVSIRFNVRGVPSVNLSASPNPVDYDTSSTLSWNVSGNADQCTASGDWSGSKSTSGGSESTGNLTSQKTYTIQCTNEYGASDPDSVTVNVNEPAACQDGIDNDGDGNVDYPNDPHCDSATDNNESPTQCNDGIDNDGDGWVDYPNDPGCDSTEDNDESNVPEDPKQCEDGINNDPEVDDLIDGNDPGCLNANDDNETEAPDFSLTKTNDLEVTIVGDSPQASNSTTISSDVSESFNGDINLSVQGITPNITGISYDWSENSNLTPSEYRNDAGDDLTVTVPGGTSSGEYVITVQGTGGGLTRTISVILNVQARDPQFENI